MFGRSLFTVSFFGANVYPENVTVGLERPHVAAEVTGKFVLFQVPRVELRPAGDPAFFPPGVKHRYTRP